MTDEKAQMPEQREETVNPVAEGPELPKDFYVKLLHLPACKSKGYCDNCGRCER